jgi:FKBP-type peptidyl-prolyl cis-trans isomerase FkpA
METIWKTLILLTALFLASGCTKQDDTAARQLEADILVIEEFLDQKGWTAQKSSSGLHYIIEDPGSGVSYPTLNSLVTVAYTGTFTNGQVFDKTNPGQPASFFLYQVIRGWQEGIPLFRKGGRGKLIIPSGLAYGTTPPPGIPANAVLVFDVELVDFQ